MNGGLPQFRGLKLTQDAGAAASLDGLHKVEMGRRCDTILVDSPGTIGAGSKNGGGNSGFQALNIVAQFGPPRRIILVGFDMRTDLGLHWHGQHGRGLNNPSPGLLPAWREAMNGAAQTLADLGIEVYNASPVSAITAFPRATIQELFP